MYQIKGLLKKVTINMHLRCRQSFQILHTYLGQLLTFQHFFGHTLSSHEELHVHLQTYMFLTQLHISTQLSELEPSYYYYSTKYRSRVQGVPTCARHDKWLVRMHSFLKNLVVIALLHIEQHPSMMHLIAKFISLA